jgi:ERCC4-related helicase
MRYLYELVLESGITIGHTYINKIKQSSDYSKIIDPAFIDVANKVEQICQSIQGTLIDHPKLGILVNILKDYLSSNNAKVFTCSIFVESFYN